MAKKKSSAKQTKKSSPKKAVKKAVPQKKSIKKAAPKAAAKKKTPGAKKSASVKKVVKKTAPKAGKKATAKKSVKATPKTKAVAKSAAKTVNQHLVKEVAPRKAIDLSGFVTPLDDRLIVQLSGAEKMTAGGLFIPDTVSDTSGNLQGTVVAVGRGHVGKKGHLRPMDVKVGDKIVFSEYAGSKIKIQNEDLVILRESDVMGVVSR